MIYMNDKEDKNIQYWTIIYTFSADPGGQIMNQKS